MGTLQDPPAGSRSESEAVSDSRPDAAQGPSGLDHPVPLLLYDGECGLCARSVQFVLKRDRAKRLTFAPLQSELGRSISERAGLAPNEVSTIVLVDESGDVSLRSTAALKVTGDLRYPWPLMRAFLIVPRFLRDGVYRWVSKNRLRWFGSAESCPLPTPETSRRFLG